MSDRFRISAGWLLCLILVTGCGYSAPDIFPLSEIRPGMKGTVYTVMQGSEVVPLEAEILGILEGGLGPGRDMIIGKLIDEKTKLTGAVHGMSGSPLMIDGKLVGALSRRLGAFEKDGHCGFTPAADMQDVSRRGDDHSSSMQLSAMDATQFLVPLMVSGGANHWQSLEGQMKEWFPGAIPVAGGHTGTGEKTLPALKAGSPLAVVLMDGDISIAGTGTVTWVEGDQVVGFGHPMFGLGPIELPIAPAEIITVLPSYLRPFKIANAGKINGTLDQDRLSAVSGRIGPIPEMATYQINRKHNHESRPTWQGRMVKHHMLAPQLISLLAANAMMDAQDMSGDFSMRATTTVKFKGLDDYVMTGYYSGNQMDRLVGALDQLLPLSKVMGRYGRQMELESVRFDVETVESQHKWVLSLMDVEDSEVAVGETLPLLIEMLNEAGEVKRIRTSWSPPEELRGKRVTLECVSGLNLNFNRQNTGDVLAGESPQSALEFLKLRFENDRLYVRGVLNDTGLLKAGQLQVGLPHAIDQTARGNSSLNTSLSSDRLVYGQQSIPVEGMVIGIQTQTVQVK